MDKKTLVKVHNRNNGTAGYIIPEMQNLQRQFAPGETKEISLEELQQLYWQRGGRILLENYLIIEDPEAVAALQLKVEPEYYYSDEDIKKIMVEGTLDQFLDMLDFSNNGVKESIKDLAVSLPLNDIAKRDVIREKLGFDVDGAIRIKDTKYDSEIDINTERKSETKKRRVSAGEVPKKERRFVVPE